MIMVQLIFQNRSETTGLLTTIRTAVLMCIVKEDECLICGKNTAENREIIHRNIYNEIKMRLKHKEQLCLGKMSCIYDDDYRIRIMFSDIQCNIFNNYGFHLRKIESAW